MCCTFIIWSFSLFSIPRWQPNSCLGSGWTTLYLPWWVSNEALQSENDLQSLVILITNDCKWGNILRIQFLNRKAYTHNRLTNAALNEWSSFITVKEMGPSFFIFAQWGGAKGTGEEINHQIIVTTVLFLFKINFYWSMVDLQCCISFCCTAKWISYTYTYTHSFLDSIPI